MKSCLHKCSLSAKGDTLRYPIRSVATRIVGIAALLGASISPAALQAQLSESAKKQMVEIVAFKRTFSSAEQKMSFNLVLLSRQSRGELPESLQPLIDLSDVDASGRPIVLVDGYVGPSLLANSAMRGVETIDGQVPIPAIAAGKIRAHVVTQDLLSLASNPDVKQLRDPERLTTNVGGVTSQGYISHGANKVIATGVRGAGVRVGVLSDSASAARVSALIATGDLPSDTVVLPNQTGPTTGEDEGTAMMEIVHDIAPDAKLFFATAYSTQAQFAANIRSLRYDYHCDIIVDDISYFAEGAFQDDTVAKAVNDVTANGALYFSAAANSGNLTSGTSGTWEGDFNAGQTGTGLFAGDGTLHNFGSPASPIYSDSLKAASTYVTLKWSDPLGGSNNDYDLYILNAAGTAVIKASTAAQTGTQNPFEAVSGTFPVGSQVVVVLYSGSQRAIRVDTNRGQLNIATAGSTYGHNAGANTFSTAAVYWNSAHTGAKAFTGGSSNPIETFSSDGPRKIFYTPDGVEITPGNLLFGTNGGTTLQKPDATAADGVVTKTPGFNPFYGTSAAAPHAAAIAALIKSANLSLTNAQIKAILLSTSLDTMAAGVDRDSGYGILSAIPAVQAATQTGNSVQ
jgi:hypothetical protein